MLPWGRFLLGASGCQNAALLNAKVVVCSLNDRFRQSPNRSLRRRTVTFLEVRFDRFTKPVAVQFQMNIWNAFSRLTLHDYTRERIDGSSRGFRLRSLRDWCDPIVVLLILPADSAILYEGIDFYSIAKTMN